MVYAYLNGGAALAGLAAAVQLLPAAIFAPAFAVAADRFRRDLPLRYGYLAQGVAHLAVGAAMLATAPVGLTLFLAAVAATLLTITRPTHGSLVPDLATKPDEVTAANVMTSTAEAVGILGGPAIAGLILISGQPGHVYLTLGTGILIAAGLAFGVRGQSPPARLSISPWAQMIAGLSAIGADRELRAIVSVGSSALIVVGAFDVLVVILAVEILGWGEAGAGGLASAAGAGALVGAVAGSTIVGRRLSRALLLAVAAAAVPLALLGWVPQWAAFLLFGGASGLLLIDLITRTLLQRTAPATTLARVLGVYEGLGQASVAVGSLLVSALFTAASREATFSMLGLLVPVVCLVSWRRIQRIDNRVPLRLDEIALLKKVPMFASLSPVVLETLAANLIPIEVSADTTVVREGDTGDALYLVADGEFTVEKAGGRLAVLRPGDIFGEIALLYDVPRTATVRSLRPGRLYTLSRGEFMVAMGATREANLMARGLADQRLDEQMRMDRTTAPD